ncbi:Hypothetical protein A7982_02511 [Minicystis rosea]|nr:Hypothetical protein A7982_02511 [Minicystis rosea]
MSRAAKGGSLGDFEGSLPVARGFIGRISIASREHFDCRSRPP